MDSERWVRILVQGQMLNHQWISLGEFSGSYNEVLRQAKEIAEQHVKRLGIDFEYMGDTRITDRSLNPWALLHIDDPANRLGFNEIKFISQNAVMLAAILELWGKGNNKDAVLAAVEAMANKRLLAQFEADKAILEYVMQEDKPSVMEVLR